MNDTDPERLADELEQDADELEQRGREVQEGIERARADWKRKRADPDVPGAVPEDGHTQDEPPSDGAG